MGRIWPKIAAFVLVLFTLSFVGDHPIRSADPEARKKLLAKFEASKNVEQQLKMLDDIDSSFQEAKLPIDVKYLLAMKLLRPHLSWHAAYAPSKGESLINDFGRYEVQRAERWREKANG
jgi:hypothetical protein